MNVFESLILSRPVKVPLDFGYNDNVVITSIDFDVRKKNGIAVKANTFIKLTKLNPKDKSVKANTEISFWNMDPTKDFVFNNFISQFTTLYGVVDALGGDVDKFEEEVLSVLEGESEDETLKFLKKGTNAKDVQETMITSFKTQVEDKIGPDSTLFKCKMVSNKAGFLEPGSEVNWILPMDSDEELPIISSREKYTRKQALEADTQKSKPDATGKAPNSKSAETTVSSSSLDAL